MYKFFISAWLALLSIDAYSDIQFIYNPTNVVIQQPLTIETVSDILLLRKKQWDNGAGLILVIQSWDAISTKMISAKFLHMTSDAYRQLIQNSKNIIVVNGTEQDTILKIMSIPGSVGVVLNYNVDSNILVKRLELK